MDDWRRIDIDLYSAESRLTDEDLKPYTDPVSLQDVQLKLQQIRSMVSKGSFGDALVYAIDEPPYGGDDNTKSTHLQTVIEVLSSTRQSEIPSIVKQLSLDQQDNLIKYLYKAMESKSGQQQGGILLAWFDKTIEVTGNGPIVRYLSDRRTV